MASRPRNESPAVYIDADVWIDLVTRNKEGHVETGEERWRSARRLFEGSSQSGV